MHSYQPLVLGLFCLRLLVCADAPPSSMPDSPWQDAGFSRERIEADWLRADALRYGTSGGAVTTASDAAGGCDGKKDGTWGFHTAEENDPWWQVDLGTSRPLERVVVYNRCDMPQRASRLMVLLSPDGTTFTRLYQHDGSVFGGAADHHPLTVPLGGAAARFVRLQLPGKAYLHLDEVEVYGPGLTANLALNRPADQSSVSTWSAPHGSKSQAGAAIIAQGLHIADRLRAQGVAVEAPYAALLAASARLTALTGDAAEAERTRLTLEAHWLVRTLVLSDPLLDFDTLLFSKQAPSRFPHLSDQYYGWWSRPGGGLYLLKGFKGDAPQIRELSAAWPEGSFLHPDLSWDGKRVLFSWCRYHREVADLKDKASKVHVPEDAFYHVFTLDLASGAIRQLTHGRYDDTDPRWLPDGRIVFTSTRKGVALSLGKRSAEATLGADLPDSYVRCGGDDYRPVPIFTLFRMDADGACLRPISAFENFEYAPAVANDGRILFTRWDYIDRFNGHFFSLWSTNPDGTNAQLVYGNFTVKPQAKIEGRPIPGSTRLLFTASAHHSITGGSLALFDRDRGTEEAAPLVRFTPEVPYPETESNISSYYVNPWPLSEATALVAWSDRHLPPHGRFDDEKRNPTNATGLYLADATGNLEPLYRDAAISCLGPLPLRARPLPPVIPDTIDWDALEEGAFLLADVYRGLGSIPRGTVKRLRVVAVPPKVQPQMNHPSIGVSHEDPGKYVLGTVPVEDDGSAYFRIPSGVPVFFQALDADGLCIQTMRTLTYAWPGQTQACLGCHEGRQAAPMPTTGRSSASQRRPSAIAAGPAGSWPLRFDTLVQPVLDRQCVSCHRPGASDRKGAGCDLTPAKARQTLLDFAAKDLAKLAYEKDRSAVGEGVTHACRLWKLLTVGTGHAGVVLDADSRERLATWMDTYAQDKGHFSDAQEAELTAFRSRLGDLIIPRAAPVR